MYSEDGQVEKVCIQKSQLKVDQGMGYIIYRILNAFYKQRLCIYFGPPQAKEISSSNDSGWLE